jgi:hypothetical protein
MSLKDIPNLMDEYTDANYVTKVFPIIMFIIGVTLFVGCIKNVINKLNK